MMTMLAISEGFQDSIVGQNLVGRGKVTEHT
jgi:hypothetical protein